MIFSLLLHPVNMGDPFSDIHTLELVKAPFVRAELEGVVVIRARVSPLLRREHDNPAGRITNRKELP